MSLEDAITSPFVLSALGTLLVTLGIIVPFLWFCSPLGLGIYILSLTRAPRLPKALSCGLLFGIGISAASSLWLWGALPLSWLLGESVLNQVAGVGLAWLIVSLAFSLGIVMTTPLFWYLRDNRYFYFLLPILWALAELIRMWAVSLVTLGHTSLLGAHFSYSALGYVLTESPTLLQFARIGGLTTLNLLMGVLAAITVFVVQKVMSRTYIRKDGEYLLFLGVVIMLCATILTQSSRRTNGAPIRVSVLSTYQPTKPRPKDISTTQSLLASSKLYQPEILILPEAISFPDTHTPLYASTTLIVSAMHVHEGDKAYSELTYKTGTGDVLGTYQKMLLMPIGEYLPYISKVLFAFVRTSESNAYTSSGDANLTPGTDVASIEWRGLHIGALICSDIQSPLLYRRIERLSGAGILIQTGNTVWLHGSSLLFRENLAIAKVHAVQNDAYYLAANNMEPSFVLSPSGDIIAEGTWWKPSLVTATIYPE